MQAVRFYFLVHDNETVVTGGSESCDIQNTADPDEGYASQCTSLYLEASAKNFDERSFKVFFRKLFDFE